MTEELWSIMLLKSKKFRGQVKMTVWLVHATCTTSCKNVEALLQKNQPFLLQSLLVTGLWDMILPPPPSPIQSCSFKFRVMVLPASLIRGGGGSQAQDHGQTIYAKYGTVSQVL